MARVVLIPLTVAVPKSTSEGFARPPWPRPGLGGRPNRLAKAWYGLSSGAGGVGVAVCGWGALRKGAAPRQPRDQALSRATRTRYVKAANMRRIVEVCRPHPTVGQQPRPRNPERATGARAQDDMYVGRRSRAASSIRGSEGAGSTSLCSAPARVLCGAALSGTAPPHLLLCGASCCEPCVVRTPPRTNERKGRRFNGSTAAGGASTGGGRCSRLTL